MASKLRNLHLVGMLSTHYLSHALFCFIFLAILGFKVSFGLARQVLYCLNHISTVPHPF
jgi:hypothetical protein